MKKTIKLLLCLLTCSAYVYSGTLSTSAWTDNSGAGLSTEKYYSHKLDLGDTQDNPAYEGIVFDSVKNSGGVIDGSAYNFAINTNSGVGSVGNIASNLETGFSHDIVSDMVYPYDGVMTLTLKGLSPGAECRLTLYSIGWEDGNRVSLIYGDDMDDIPADDNSAFRANQDEFGQGNGVLVFYDYIAPESGELNVTFKAVNGGGWHLYGFSNETSIPTVVPASVMESIYEEVKTPYKYGIVIPQQNGQLVDSPSVFRYDNRWYMMYITHDGSGYTTELAVSDNLLQWEPLGTIMKRYPEKDTWDNNQLAGYIALQDTTWGGSYELETYNDKYWLSYIGGRKTGYETAPLSIGVASTLDPTSTTEWQHDYEPVLTTVQQDVRWWENNSLYKSNIIHDESEKLGWPYIMYYNAVFEGGYEQIGMAVSKDMVNWTRFGGNDPVLTHGGGITGDPQVVKMGDVWVMFYFGAGWCPGAVERFACSYDLVNWTKWEGQDLIKPTEDWDAAYAHKPWVLKVDGVVYHYYCATGSEGRTIALATSKPLPVGDLDGDHDVDFSDFSIFVSDWLFNAK